MAHWKLYRDKVQDFLAASDFVDDSILTETRHKVMLCTVKSTQRDTSKTGGKRLL